MQFSPSGGMVDTLLIHLVFICFSFVFVVVGLMWGSMWSMHWTVMSLNVCPAFWKWQWATLETFLLMLAFVQVGGGAILLLF